MKKSNKRSKKRSYKSGGRFKRSVRKSKNKKSGGQPRRRFGRRPPRTPNPDAMKVLDDFQAGKLTLAKTVGELQDIFCPTKLNLKFKKEVLEQFKKGEISKEEAERKLHMFFRFEREFIPKNTMTANKNKNKNKNNNNKQSNN